MAKVKVTQIKSKNGSTQRQRANLESLGLRRMHQIIYNLQRAPARMLSA